MFRWNVVCFPALSISLWFFAAWLCKGEREDKSEKYKIPKWFSNSIEDVYNFVHIYFFIATSKVEQMKKKTDTNQCRLSSQGEIAVTYDLWWIRLYLSSERSTLYVNQPENFIAENKNSHSMSQKFIQNIEVDFFSFSLNLSKNAMHQYNNTRSSDTENPHSHSIYISVIFVYVYLSTVDSDQMLFVASRF